MIDGSTVQHICAACGVPTTRTASRRTPRYCQTCGQARRLAANRAWKKRNAAHVRAYQAEWLAKHRQSQLPQQHVCAACRAATELTANGSWPRYCHSCRQARQLAASRAWKERNVGQVQEYRTTYNATHRDDNKARARKRRHEKADEVRAYRRRLYKDRQQASNTATVLAYRQRHPGSQAEIENRRRARLLKVFVEPVSAAEIRERDGELCGICGEFVPVSQQSLDHIIPLARGGTHDRSNLQLAHHTCNSRKGARPQP